MNMKDKRVIKTIFSVIRRGLSCVETQWCLLSPWEYIFKFGGGAVPPCSGQFDMNSVRSVYLVQLS